MTRALWKEFRFFMYLASGMSYLYWAGFHVFNLPSDGPLNWLWTASFSGALFSHIYLRYDEGFNWGRHLVKMPIWRGVIWPLLVMLLWALLLYHFVTYFYGFYRFEPVLYASYAGISLLSLRVAEKFGEYFGSRGGYIINSVR